MAVLVRKSEDTIRRDERAHELKTRLDGTGRVLVSVGDFLRIGRLRLEDLTAGATPAESAEVLRARETITALRVQVGELTGRLRHSDALVTTLGEQLAQKDRQLGRADPPQALRPPIGVGNCDAGSRGSADQPCPQPRRPVTA